MLRSSQEYWSIFQLLINGILENSPDTAHKKSPFRSRLSGVTRHFASLHRRSLESVIWKSLFASLPDFGWRIASRWGTLQMMDPFTHP